MQHRLTLRIPWLFAAGALVAGVVVALLVFPGSGSSSGLGGKTPSFNRIGASAWNAGEISTEDTEDGLVFYDKTFAVKADVKELFVTLFATSDQHDNATLQLGCFVGGVPCDSYDEGWVTVGNHADFDWHDNSISQSWCVKLNGNSATRNLQLAMRSGGEGAGGEVFMEHVVVYVDAAGGGVSCGDDGFIANSETTTTLAPSHKAGH